MNTGHFYFIKDQYFIDFPDPYLAKNKEIIDGHEHKRPCFYAFEDGNNKGLYWLIPFSSQTQKYHRIYNDKIEKYGVCDVIVFGNFLGHEKAFLIQNMCPISSKYINNEYVNSTTNTPVRINGSLENELISKARHVLTL